MKYLLIISHCILNTASKVAMDEGELKEEYEKRDRLIRCVKIISSYCNFHVRSLSSMVRADGDM